jgi:hypothetical protein
VEVSIFNQYLTNFFLFSFLRPVRERVSTNLRISHDLDSPFAARAEGEAELVRLIDDNIRQRAKEIKKQAQDTSTVKRSTATADVHRLLSEQG